MKKILQLFILCVTGLLLGSCEDVVQIKLDEGSKLFVIDAFVNNLPGKQTIRVTTNDSYFSNRIAPPVADAAVILKDVTADKEYKFVYAGEGNYNYTVSASDPIALVDHQYELKVTIEGMSYSSLVNQRRTASIDSIHPELIDGSGGFGGGPIEPFYFCTLSAKDKTDNNPDYYWIKTSRNDTLLFGPNDINISIDGTNGPITGLEVDSTSFTPPVTFLGFNSFRKGSTCGVEIHSISKETYFFFLQAQTQINNGGLFATTPENVRTNIRTPQDAKTKAVGWFNMATVVSKKIDLPK